MLGEIVLPISMEELLFAMRVADRASTGQIPSDALNEILSKPSPGLLPTDCPENRAAFAVLDAFSDRDSRFRTAVLWRTFQIDGLMSAKSSQGFVRRSEDGGLELSERFLYAVATCEMRHGKKVAQAAFKKALKVGAALYSKGD